MNKRKRVADQKHRAKRHKYDEKRKAALGATPRPSGRAAAVQAASVAESTQAAPARRTTTRRRPAATAEPIAAVEPGTEA